MAIHSTLNALTVTDFDTGIPEIWAPMVIADAESKAFWSKFEGAEGENKPIVRKDDYLKEAGDYVNFTTMGALYNDGVTGNNQLEGQEAKMKVDGFQLQVDWLRNAVSYSRRAEHRALFNTAMNAGRLLSNWWARTTDYNLFNQLISTASPTTLYAGSATSLTTLSPNTCFAFEDLENIHLELEQMGAEPFMMERDNGEEFPVYGCVISEIDAYYLRRDQRWIDAQAEAAVRGEKNRLFTGALGMVAGMVVYVHRGIKGRQGTPLRPSAKVISTGLASTETTTITVQYNDTNDNMTKYFASSGNLSIVDSSGNVEHISYSAKSNYTFTITSRAASIGSNNSSSSAPLTFSGGEEITQGYFQSAQIGFGANIACRSFAKAVAEIEQEYDYKFIKGIGVAGVFGQKEYLDSDDAVKNYVLHYSAAPTSNANVVS